jgi:hypothetical protein
MALVEAEQLGGRECVRVYIAGRLSEAQRVEQALSDQGIDYYVEIERFERKILGLIRREYDGAAFYVTAGRAAASRELLRAARLTAGLEDEDDDGPA